VRIRCHLLEPTDVGAVSLRRFGGACALPHGYHNAEVGIGTAPFVGDYRTAGYRRGPDVEELTTLPWPERCGCGYVFSPDDSWQHVTERLYWRADSSATVRLRDAEVGAMWFAPWYEDVWKGPDGRCLIVMTPGGEWTVDGPANNGPGWRRSGTPPLVTAHPSIGFKNPDGSWRYHGWLRDGYLVDA